MSDHSHAMEGNFIFQIERLKGVIFNLQSVELPSVTLTERNIVAQPTDFGRPGEKLIFDKLNLSFLVDEDLNNYTEVLDWMWQCVNPNSGIMGKESKLISDAVLIVKSKKGTTSKRHYRFHDCFPTIVGPLTFSNTGTENRPLVCSVSLSYSHFHDENSKIQDMQLKPVGFGG